MLLAEKHLETIGAEALYRLREIVHELSSFTRAKEALGRTLEILETYGVARSAVRLHWEASSEKVIEVSRGLTPDERKTFLSLPSAGATATKRAGNLCTIARAGEKRRTCTPIAINREVYGMLAVELPLDQRIHSVTLAFVELVASLIAQGVKGIHGLAGTRDVAGAGIVRLPVEGDFSRLIGQSVAMKIVYDQIRKVTSCNATVMVRGESGTGKELVAHAIHQNSLRKHGPFIKVNCAALPESLIESELFGYEKGAFTGAHSEKKGRFELADGGTLFLDEIGEVNAGTAVKLLRVLQEREFERVGGTRTLKADVRLVVATNKDLERAIAAGSFREDLYYRLNVFSIFMPPLRERAADVRLLAAHFLEHFRATHGMRVKRLSEAAYGLLENYHWPGNVRELSNIIESALLLCEGDVITERCLPALYRQVSTPAAAARVSLRQTIETCEADLIRNTLRTTRGNRSWAAKLLQTTERIVTYKARKYQIDCTDFRHAES